MKRLFFLMTAATFALTACSPSVTVRSDYARGVNFREFDSYVVEPERNRNNDPVLGSELNQERIAKALDGALRARGLSRSNGGNADLIVRFGTDSRDRQSIQSNNNFSPWMWRFGGPMNTYSRNYEENRIVVNVYDARTNRQIWQGWASGQFFERKNQAENAIYMSVDKIMARFPVQPSQEFARER